MDDTLKKFLDREIPTPLKDFQPENSISSAKYTYIGNGFLEIRLNGEQYPPSIVLDYLNKEIILPPKTYTPGEPWFQRKIPYESFNFELDGKPLPEEVSDVIQYMNKGYKSKYNS